MLALATVVAAVVAVDWPVLHAQALSFDDSMFVGGNPLVSHPGWASARRVFREVRHPSTVGGYYLPLSQCSLMLDYAMGGRGTDLRVFHRTNLVLHVAIAVLIALLLFRLFGSPWAAALAALLFALHPLTVEPVAWVSERKTLLAALFGVAALLCFVEHAGRGGHGWRIGSLVLYLLALLSKPTVTMLPLLLLLLDAWPLRRLSRRAVIEIWPWVLLSLLSAAVTLVSNASSAAHGPPSAGYLRWPLQVADALGFYLGKVVWPARLTSLYPDRAPFTLSNPTVIGGLAAALTLTAGLAALTRRTRGPLVGWLFFVIALAPTLGLVRYSPVALSDKHLYFPAIGLLLPIAAGLAAAGRSAFLRGTRAAVRIAPLLLVLGMEAVATRGALRPWRTSVDWWRHMAALNPTQPVLENQLGLFLETGPDPEEALGCFRRAVGLDPRYADAQYNLGLVLLVHGSTEAAIQRFRAVVSLDPRHPGARAQLGLALQRAGRLDEAEVQLREAIRLEPDHVEALKGLGLLALARGRPQEALPRFRDALRVVPGDPAVHFETAAALLELPGRQREAVAELERALRLRSDWPDALNALAWLRATSADPALRDTAEALRLSARAAELTYGADPSVLDTRAAALASAGRFSEAVRTARTAVEATKRAGMDSLSRQIAARAAAYARRAPYRERAAPSGRAR